MPRKAKVSPAQRKDWLKRFEGGESEESIAGKHGFTRRAVHAGVERARLESHFEAAQREQLRGALHEHQSDLMGQVDRIQQAAHTPALDFQDPRGRDFGLEDIDPVPKDGSELSVILASPAPRARTGSESPPRAGAASPFDETGPLVFVERDLGGPKEVRVPDEDSRLWAALKQHVDSKDPLWRAASDWKQALLVELQARAALNRAIRRLAEKAFKLPVQQRDGPRLTPRLVSLVRLIVSRAALGEPGLDVTNWLDWQGRRLIYVRDSATLVEGTDDTDHSMKAFTGALKSAGLLAEVKAASESYRKLEVRTSRVRDHCGSYMLVHHIPGRCNICKRLGGQ